MARSDESAPASPATDPRALLIEVARMTGMPFPNLLYRTLAEQPGRLQDCWTRLRPGLVAGGTEGARARLLTAADDAQGAGPESGSRRRPDTVRAAIPSGALPVVLDTYDVGNSCNAVLIRVLLDGAPGRATSGASSAPARADSHPSAAETAAPRHALPPMLAIDAMSPAARERVLTLARLVDPSGAVVPSLFRHLAHDVALLDAAHDVLSAATAAGELDRSSASVAAAAQAHAGTWPAPVAAVTDHATRELLEPFARAIPRMLAVSTLLRARLLA